MKPLSKPVFTGPYDIAFLAIEGGMTECTIESLALPQVICPICGDNAIHDVPMFPSVKIPKGFNRKILSNYDDVPPEDFEILEKEFRRANRSLKQVLPGMWVGPVTIRITGKPNDVICDEGVYFCERAVEALRDAKVLVRPMPVKVLKRGARIEDYYVFEPAVVDLFSEKCAKKYYTRCPACAGLARRPGVRVMEENNARLFVRSRWPKNEGVVYSPDLMLIRYSDEFVDALRPLELTGIAFKRNGNWE